MTRRPFCSTFAERVVRGALVVLAVSLGLALAPRVAHAQACCATPSAFAPARLRTGEKALVGLVLGGSGVTGSFGADRSFATTSSTEVDLSQRLFLGWAPWTRGELSLTLPFVETIRRSGGTSEASGGVSDARLTSRIHLIDAGQDRVVPGIQILTGLTLPTGVPADRARLPLATDATGTGAFQLDGGVALEQTFGRFLVNLTGTVAWRAARSAGRSTTQLGPLFSVFGAASYTFPNALSLAVSLAYEASLDSRVDGVEQSDSGTAKTTIGVAGSLPIARGVRLTAGLSWTPHVTGLGKNELATFGGSLGIVYAWGGPRSCPMHPGQSSCGCPE